MKGIPDKSVIENQLIDYKLKTDLTTLGKILAAPNKKKILCKCSYPKTPKEIAKDTNLNFPTISKTIRELEDLKLITINNKNLRKGKIITISQKGIQVLKDLDIR